MKFHQDPQELSIWIFKYCLIFIPLIYNGGKKAFWSSLTALPQQQHHQEFPPHELFFRESFMKWFYFSPPATSQSVHFLLSHSFLGRVLPSTNYSQGCLITAFLSQAFWNFPLSFIAAGVWHSPETPCFLLFLQSKHADDSGFKADAETKA